jgi:hypothetical protein
MGSNEHQLRDETRPGDGLAFYAALVRTFLPTFPFDLTPHSSLDLRTSERPLTGAPPLKSELTTHRSGLAYNHLDYHLDQ